MEDFDIRVHGTAAMVLCLLIAYFFKRVSFSKPEEESLDASLVQKVHQNHPLLSFFLSNAVKLWWLGIGVFALSAIIWMSPGLFFATLFWTIAFPSVVTVLFLRMVTLKEISFLTFPTTLYLRGHIRRKVDQKKNALLITGVQNFLQRELPELLKSINICEVMKKLYFFSKYSTLVSMSGKEYILWTENLFQTVFQGIHDLPHPKDERQRIEALVGDYNLSFYNLPSSCGGLFGMYIKNLC